MDTLRLNLNAASEHELTQLPRISADKARRIVHYRAIRKGFRDWDDFAATVGITEADVEVIRTRAWIGRWEGERGHVLPRRLHRPVVLRRPKHSPAH